MATMCKQCGGTGLIINNKYCRCSDGKLKKAMDGIKTKVQVATEEETAKALEAAAKAVIKKANEAAPVDSSNRNKKGKRVPGIEIGAWVERDGLVCMVDKMRSDSVHVLSFRDITGNKVERAGWVNMETVKPMPVEGFEDFKAMCIDLALLTHDHKWFKQLMKARV